MGEKCRKNASAQCTGIFRPLLISLPVPSLGWWSVHCLLNGQENANFLSIYYESKLFVTHFHRQVYLCGNRYSACINEGVFYLLLNCSLSRSAERCYCSFFTSVWKFTRDRAKKAKSLSRRAIFYRSSAKVTDEPFPFLSAVLRNEKFSHKKRRKWLKKQ